MGGWFDFTKFLETVYDDDAYLAAGPEWWAEWNSTIIEGFRLYPKEKIKGDAERAYRLVERRYKMTKPLWIRNDKKNVKGALIKRIS